MWTPSGAATLEVTAARDGLWATACGPGAEWALENAPAMVGLLDDLRGFRADLHPAVLRAARARPGLRMGRSLTVWDVVVPVVLGQRVTSGEARRSWWQLVGRAGRDAPGTDAVRLPPTPDAVAAMGDADWHVLGVERGRADAVRGLLRILPALERAAGRGAPDLVEVAATVRRVGPWTATALAGSVTGDADVVLLGDLHVPHSICHALAGEARGDDARMLELLEPFRPHRGRVVRLLKSAGARAPRRGPRYAPLPIASM